MQGTTAPSVQSRGSARIDVCVAAVSMALYVLWACHFRYRGTLGDADLYRMLRGLLDGAHSGAGLASGLQYGKGFSFGYILGMYRFANGRVLADPQRLIALINGIGFWSAAAGGIFFWAALSVLNDVRRATVTLVLFLFAPIQLEQGTTGHPGLLSFAFFWAAALVLFVPVRGVRGVCCHVVGFLLLVLALVTRADIMMAFPFLVMAQADFRSIRLLLRSALRHGIIPVLATAAFFLLKHFFVDGEKRPGPSLHEFFNSYYKISHVPVGVAICFLGCGVFTTLVGGCAAVRMLRAARCAPPASERRVELFRASAIPLSLVLPSLVFWVANPTPARHFVLCVAGLSMLAAEMLFFIPLTWRSSWAYAIAFGIVLASQAFGAICGPIILRHYSFKIIAIDGQPRVMPLAPIGDSISFHRAVQSELWSADAFAERVGGLCDAKAIVLTDHMPQVSSHLYGWRGSWSVEEGKLHRFSILTARDESRTIVFLSVHEGWPEDPVAAILAEEALEDYKLIRDRDTISVFDKTEIPRSRAAQFGCSR